TGLASGWDEASSTTCRRKAEASAKRFVQCCGWCRLTLSSTSDTTARRCRRSVPRRNPIGTRSARELRSRYRSWALFHRPTGRSRSPSPAIVRVTDAFRSPARCTPDPLRPFFLLVFPGRGLRARDDARDVWVLDAAVGCRLSGSAILGFQAARCFLLLL